MAAGEMIERPETWNALNSGPALQNLVRALSATYYRGMKPWRDISLPIGPESIAWEGLAEAKISAIASIEDGDAVRVGMLDCCLHSGTHADAPLHVFSSKDPESTEGLGQILDAAELAVDKFIGPAQLIETDSPERIGLDELKQLGLDQIRATPFAERILIRTPRQFNGRDFPSDIPHLEPDAAEYLLWLGAKLVGVNVPSLDPLDSREMLAHKLWFREGGVVLENLDLRAKDLEPGRYELNAPPLKILKGDAAPVRALLRAVSG